MKEEAGWLQRQGEAYRIRREDDVDVVGRASERERFK